MLQQDESIGDFDDYKVICQVERTYDEIVYMIDYNE